MEEIHCRIEKAHQTQESKYGIENKVLKQFRESLPWLNRNVYFYYVKHNLPPQSVIANSEDLQLISTINESTINDSSTLPGTEQKIISTRGSQPKGSTNESKATVSMQFNLAKNYLSVEFDKVKKEANKTNKRVKKGAYDEIIKCTREQYNLPEHTDINKKTILSCLKPKHKLLVAHCGPSSPMLKLEPLLLEMILQLSDMNAPVTCREGLELA